MFDAFIIAQAEKPPLVVYMGDGFVEVRVDMQTDPSVTQSAYPVVTCTFWVLEYRMYCNM